MLKLHAGTVYFPTKETADKIAAELNEADTEGWSYAVYHNERLGFGIRILDEEGEFVHNWSGMN